MAREIVTIVVGGTRYGTWETVDLDLGAKAARGFSFVANDKTSDAIGDDWPLAPG